MNIKNIKSFIRKIKRHFNNGTSLMETLIWVGIVAVFTSLIGFVSFSVLEKSKVKAVKNDLQTIEAALFMYYDEEGNFPDESTGLNILIDKNFIKLQGNKNKLTDPWGTEYIYTVETNNQGFTVKSLGSDKTEGGDGTGKDIVYSSSKKTEGQSGNFDYGTEFNVEKDKEKN